MAFRVLAAGNFPSHRTLCEFRRRHLSDFKKLFVEVVGWRGRRVLRTSGRLSIDGTKVRANASKRKAMSYARMLEEERRLKGEIEALVSRARETDAAEDARFGEAFRGGELPEELSRREDRLAAIWAAKARLEARQREADDARGRGPGSKRNPKGGRPYKREIRRAAGQGAGQLHGSRKPDHEDLLGGISAVLQRRQLAVEGANQLIVATEVSSNASDQGRMLPLVDEVQAAHGERPGSVLTDAGYCNEADLEALEARGVDGYVALGREGRRAVAVNAAKHPAKARMAKKLATSAGRARYAQRKWLSEAPNGWIKEALGFRRFSLRGLNNERGEWDLVCPGVERQTDAGASSGLMPRILPSNRAERRSIQAHIGAVETPRRPNARFRVRPGEFIANLRYSPGRGSSYGAGS